MTDEVKSCLVSELEDLNTALIFLNDGLRRTEQLKADTTKQGYPDIDQRIERIKKSIGRYQPKANQITAALKNEADRIEAELKAEKERRI